MTKTKELRVFTKPTPPADGHQGGVMLMLDDIHNLFTKTELNLFQCFLFAQKKDQFSQIAGRDMTAFLKSGGVANFKEEYLNIDFIYPLSQKDINDIKKRAEEMQSCLSTKEEHTFDLSSSDASMLAAIIGG